MADDIPADVAEWIRTYHEKGYSRDALKQRLQDSGYDPGMVDTVLGETVPENKETPGQRPAPQHREEYREPADTGGETASPAKYWKIGVVTLVILGGVAAAALLSNTNILTDFSPSQPDSAGFEVTTVSCSPGTVTVTAVNQGSNEVELGETRVTVRYVLNRSVTGTGEDPVFTAGSWDAGERGTAEWRGISLTPGTSYFIDVAAEDRSTVTRRCTP